MDSMDLPEFLEYLPAVRRALLRHLVPESCIATSRIVRQLLGDSGLEAHVIPVKARVGNAAAARFIEVQDWDSLRQRLDGAHVVNVGDPGHAARPGFWAGHLAVLCQGVLIDASIDQASRPQHGILLKEPLAVPLPTDFLRPGRVVRGTVWGLFFEYGYCPDNLSYLRSPSWRLAPRLFGVARRALREAESRAQ